MIKIITPAGNLFVDSIEEANDMKKKYGYPYVVIDEEEDSEE